MKRLTTIRAVSTAFLALVLVTAQETATSQQLQRAVPPRSITRQQLPPAGPQTPAIQQQQQQLQPQQPRTQQQQPQPQQQQPQQQRQQPQSPQTPQRAGSSQPQQTTFNMASRQISRGSGTAADPWRGWDKYLNSLGNLKRITAYWPTGYYQIQQTVNIPSDGAWRLMGDGIQRSIIRGGDNFVGPALVCTAEVNKSVGAFLDITGLTIENTNSNVKFSVPGGSVGVLLESTAYVNIRDVQLLNWRCNLLLDQASHVRFEHCHSGATWYSGKDAAARGVWIVCGDSRRPGSAGGCTNVIHITDCVFSGFQNHIVDDGGYTHNIRDCTFNVYYPAIYAAGVVKLVVDGNYFEATGQQGSTIQIDHRLFDDPKVSVGGCAVPSIIRNYFVSGEAPVITFRTGGACDIIGNFFGGIPEGGVQITGAPALGAGAITAHSNFYYGKNLFDDGKPASRFGQTPQENAAQK